MALKRSRWMARICFDCWAQGGKELVSYAREQSRPVLVEAKTVRFIGHSVSDSQPYRTRDDINKLRQSKDPLENISVVLLDAGWATEDDLDSMNDTIMEQVMAAVAFAEGKSGTTNE